MLHERFPPIVAYRRGNYRWTALQDDMVRQLFAADATGETMAATINEIFSTTYSPNAVLCRAHVIGLRRPGKRPTVEWTDAMNATLRDGIENRMTFAQIGEAMRLSAGAIGSQARRLGIKVAPNGDRRSPEERAASREAIEGRDAARRLEKRLNRLLNFVPREWQEIVPLPVSAPAVTDPLNLTLMEVGRMQCHWITNDDMTAPLYCGHPIAKGSWCAKHREVATVEIRPWSDRTVNRHVHVADSGGPVRLLHNRKRLSRLADKMRMA